MGKANPALVVGVPAEWSELPEVQALKDQGHHVNIVPLERYDLVLHPAAHGWTAEMFQGPYLKVALTAARKRRKEGKAS